MKQSLGLRTSQQLSLTPQLQQSIRLLQLSTLDLHQEVQQMLELNPFLEADATEPESVLSLEAIQMQQQAHEQLASPEPVDESFDELAEPLHLAQSTAVLDWSNSQQESHWDAADDTAFLQPDLDAQIDFTVASDTTLYADTPMQSSFQSRMRHESQDGSWLDTLEAGSSLAEDLVQQIRWLQLPQKQEWVMFFLAHSINQDGYLEETTEQLASAFVEQQPNLEFQEAIELFENVIPIFQGLEPTAIGARTLSECLRLQLQQLLRDNPQRYGAGHYRIGLALKICQHPLELLAKRDYKSLAQLCSAPETSVKEAAKIIANLDPYPARKFQTSTTQTVVPDVLVKQQGSVFEVFLNDQVVPKLLVNQSYAECLQYDKSAAHQSLQKTLQEARWFIKSIHQRFDTILRVSRCIVERQHLFFKNGAFALKPLVLKEVADELGLHESTVSRVTTQKYMATPHGTFELKYFFTSGLSTQSGSATSSTVVREWIKTWIGQESPDQPLSDQKIADLLEAKGIECARRTVAKYRESLKIAPASLRRQN